MHSVSRSLDSSPRAPATPDPRPVDLEKQGAFCPPPTASSPRSAQVDSLEHAAPGPRVQPLPRQVPEVPGYPQLGPSRQNEALAARINAVLPQLAQQVAPALAQRTGWQTQLDRAQVELVDRAGMRAMLRTQEGYGIVTAFFLSWVMPIVYAPAMARVLVVAPTARRYDEPTLRYQLARALVGGVVAHQHRSFFDYVVERLVSAYQRPHDVYACRAWAQALGDSVATQVAPAGRRGPWWQRLGLTVLWPFAFSTIGPHRLARRFVPILEETARGPRGPQLVDRMFAFPPLCSVLYDARGRRVLTFDPTPNYKRANFREDVLWLRQFNRDAGATFYSVED